MPVSEAELKAEPSSMGDYIPMVKRRDNISLYILKPTDACHSDMLTALKAKGNVENMPMVEFSDDGTSGHLRFKNDRNYTFSMTKMPNNGDTDVVVEKGDHFEELGNFTGRIQVQANNETFEKTRQNMLEVEKRAKEKQAKEIRQSGKGSSSHSKVSKILANVAKSTNGSSQRPVTPIHSKRVSPVLNQSQQPPPPVKPSTNDQSRSTKPIVSSGGKPKFSPSSNSSPGLNGSTASPQSTAIAGKPLRQRIIQLLVVRPYSKAELLVRLNQDCSLSDGEKAKFEDLLKEVGQLKGNDKFTLNKQFLNLVDVKWPGYDKYTTQSVTKVVEAVLHHSDANGSASNSLKRPNPVTPDEDEAIPGIKLKKSSSHHYIPGKNKSAEAKLTASTAAAANAAVEPPQRAATEQRRQSKSLQSSPDLHPPTCATTTAEAKVSPPQHNYSVIPDFLTQFPPVRNASQRQEYRQEFDRDYKNYLELHSQLEAQSKKFLDFQRQLEGLTDEEECRRIEQRICDEYERYEADREIQDIRARHKWFQAKLEVLKKRVVDYDQAESLRQSSLSLPERPHDDITVM